MALTLSIRSTIETAERLARTTLWKFYAAYNIINLNNQLLTVAYNTILNLDSATTYFITCDPLATINIGWILNSQVVEIPINGFTIINPPSAPYLRNTSLDSSSTPIPVKIVYISNELQTTQISTIAGLSIIVTENLKVLSTNTISNLAQIYNGQFAILMINGQSFASVATNPFFTISSTSVEWNSVNAGFQLTTADSVQVVYTTFATSGSSLSSPTFSSETITVTATNTFASLDYIYNGILATLTVNGQTVSYGSGFFTISGQTLTWCNTIAGYSILTTDIVQLLYTH
jgi:hypothetical protein